LSTQTSFSDNIKLVIFELASEEFGVEIKKIDSILRMQPITKIPYAARFIEGVINYRGKPLVVIDLRKRFKLATNDQKTDDMRIIVLDFQPFLLGMIVDTVSEVFSLPYTMIEPVPENLISIDLEQEYFLGVGNINEGERLIILLDLGKIFTDNEIGDLGLLFNGEEDIRAYLEENRILREKEAENLRLASSQNQTEQNLMAHASNIHSSDVSSQDVFLEQERAVVRQLALRDIQDEYGITLDDHSVADEEIIYVNEGDALSEEEGVDYIYTDENGKEISREEFNLLSFPEEEKVQNMESSTSSDMDSEIAALLLAAEEDNSNISQESPDLLDES